MGGSTDYQRRHLFHQSLRHLWVQWATAQILALAEAYHGFDKTADVCVYDMYMCICIYICIKTLLRYHGITCITCITWLCPKELFAQCAANAHEVDGARSAAIFVLGSMAEHSCRWGEGRKNLGKTRENGDFWMNNWKTPWEHGDFIQKNGSFMHMGFGADLCKVDGKHISK